MKYSFEWLKDFVDIDITPRELAERLTVSTAEVIEIKEEDDDTILDLEILSNRGDLTSHFGLARDIAALLNKELKNIEVAPLKLTTEEKITVKIQDKNLCPRYSAVVIDGVQIKESPLWIKKRLEKIGIRSINNVVDVTNYVMAEIGQPLHAFDFNKIEIKGLQKNTKKPQIIVRRAENNERITTLDGIERVLDEEMLVIADVEKPIALAGVMGGANSEVDEKTTKIIFESAHFNPDNIRKTSRKLGLRTEAVERFEKYVDINLTSLALLRAIYLLKEQCPEIKVGELIDIYPKKVYPWKIRLNLARVKDFLGIEIASEKIKKILESLGLKPFDYQSSTFDYFIPTFRPDLQNEQDLLEEIIRVYGLDKVPETLPETKVKEKIPKEILLENQIKDILTEIGFFEICTFTLLKKETLDNFNLSTIDSSSFWQIKNPLSNRREYMRPSIIPNLVETLTENIKNFALTPGKDKVKLFEVGKVYFKNKKNQAVEKYRLGGLIFGEKRDEGFFVAKGIIEYLMNKLQITSYKLQTISQTSYSTIYHPFRSAELIINGKSIGIFGEIHPSILQKYELSKRVCCFELDLDEILNQLSVINYQLSVPKERSVIYKPFSKFPPSMRDLAIIVEENIDNQKITEAIIETDPLIVDANLFDEYRGEKIGYGKKSVAFHITYQALDRTLTDEEVNKVHQKVIDVLKEKFLAIPRI